MKYQDLNRIYWDLSNLWVRLLDHDELIMEKTNLEWILQTLHEEMQEHESNLEINHEI